MKKLCQDIIKWNVDTFPNATEDAFLLKLKEELLECISDIDSRSTVTLKEEIADVVIVAVSWLARCHNDNLDNIVRKKMTIVKSRQFGIEDANGNRVKL